VLVLRREQIPEVIQDGGSKRRVIAST